MSAVFVSGVVHGHQTLKLLKKASPSCCRQGPLWGTLGMLQHRGNHILANSGQCTDGIGKNSAFTNIEAVSWIPEHEKFWIPDTSKNKVKYMENV